MFAENKMFNLKRNHQIPPTTKVIWSPLDNYHEIKRGFK